ATSALSATSSGGSFWLAAATACGGSSGEKMRALAALSTGSEQAATSARRMSLRDTRAGTLAWGFLMQSLKDKLPKAGLVTKEQAERAPTPNVPREAPIPKLPPLPGS